MYETVGDRFTRAVVTYSEAIDSADVSLAALDQARREYVAAGYAFLAALGPRAPEQVLASVRRAEQAGGRVAPPAAHRHGSPRHGVHRHGVGKSGVGKSGVGEHGASEHAVDGRAVDRHVVDRHGVDQYGVRRSATGRSAA